MAWARLLYLLLYRFSLIFQSPLAPVFAEQKEFVFRVVRRALRLDGYVISL